MTNAAPSAAPSAAPATVIQIVDDEGYADFSIPWGKGASVQQLQAWGAGVARDLGGRWSWSSENEELASWLNTVAPIPFIRP